MPRITPLKIAIVESGLTAKEIAARIGRAPEDVSRWTNGSRRATLETKLAIADVLERPVEELFPGTPALRIQEPSA